MAVTVREVVTDAATGATPCQVTTGAGTLATDLLVAIGFSDFFDLATGFGPPTPGTWAEVVTVDRGVNDSKIRAWVSTASGGAQSVTLDPILDEDVGLVVLVLAGADTTTPTDGSDGATSVAATPSVHTAPSISPATDDALLVCAAITQVNGDGGGSYTAPGGMTEQADFTLNGFAHATAATEPLSASGATGARAFTYSVGNVAGAAVSLAIKALTSAAVGAGVGFGGGFGQATPAKLGTGTGVVAAGGFSSASPAKVGFGQATGAGGSLVEATAIKLGAASGQGVGGGFTQAQVTTIRHTQAVAAGGGMGHSAASRTAAGSGTGFGGGFATHSPTVQTIIRPFTGTVTRPFTGIITRP